MNQTVTLKPEGDGTRFTFIRAGYGDMPALLAEFCAKNRPKWMKASMSETAGRINIALRWVPAPEQERPLKLRLVHLAVSAFYREIPIIIARLNAGHIADYAQSESEGSLSALIAYMPEEFDTPQPAPKELAHAEPVPG